MIRKLISKSQYSRMHVILTFVIPNVLHANFKEVAVYSRGDEGLYQLKWQVVAFIKLQKRRTRDFLNAKIVNLQNSQISL